MICSCLTSVPYQWWKSECRNCKGTVLCHCAACGFSIGRKQFRGGMICVCILCDSVRRGVITKKTAQKRMEAGQISWM